MIVSEDKLLDAVPANEGHPDLQANQAWMEHQDCQAVPEILEHQVPMPWQLLMLSNASQNNVHAKLQQVA